MQYAVLMVSMSTKGHRVSQINASRGPAHKQQKLINFIPLCRDKTLSSLILGAFGIHLHSEFKYFREFFLILSYWFLKQIDVSEYNRILKVSLLEMYPFLRSLEKRKVRTTLALLTYPQASRSLWNFIVKKWERGRYCITSSCVWGMFTKTDLTDTFIVV